MDADAFPSLSALAGWTTWSDPCTLHWIRSSWMPGNHTWCSKPRVKKRNILTLPGKTVKSVKNAISSFSSGLLLSCSPSATWCWSPATPVTCPAAWTGSTSRSTRQRITWWFCVRRLWLPNQSAACRELTHRENRPSEARKLDAQPGTCSARRHFKKKRHRNSSTRPNY